MQPHACRRTRRHNGSAAIRASYRTQIDQPRVAVFVSQDVSQPVTLDLPDSGGWPVPTREVLRSLERGPVWSSTDDDAVASD